MDRQVQRTVLFSRMHKSQSLGSQAMHRYASKLLTKSIRCFSTASRAGPAHALANSCILVTGAGSGIGRAIVDLACNSGARVVAADRDKGLLTKLSRDLEPSPPGESQLATISGDVSSASDRYAMIDEALRFGNRLDGLVNCAGVDFGKPFLETSMEDFDRVIDVDLRAVFALTQLAAKAMVKYRPREHPINDSLAIKQLPSIKGSIVNISSVHSVATLPGVAPYAAAKAGVVGMTRSIANELAPLGVRVNTVSPGLVATKIWDDVRAAAPSRQAAQEHWARNIPQGAPNTPLEIAQAVCFLLSPMASAFQGANIVVDGGMTSYLVSQPPYKPKPHGAGS